MSTFYPLNVITEYSMLKSGLKIDDFVKKIKTLSYEGGAICDYSHLYGFGHFSKACKREKIKAIYGVNLKCLIDDDSYEISLFARNLEGYYYLLSLVSNQKELYKLDDFNKTEDVVLVIHSSSLPSNFIESDHHELIKLTSLFKSNDYFGIEIYSNEDSLKIKALREYLSDHSFKTVAFPKTCYLNKKDHATYALIKAIDEGTQVDENEVEGPYFLLGQAAVEALYTPEEINNTQEIANLCTFDFDEIHGNLIKVSDDSDKVLRDEVIKKAGSLYQLSEYKDRIEHELNIISRMGFADYFLIVQDYVSYAKNNDIAVGPGRGSACGSLVCYILGITECNPLVFNLSFERFLNPLRATMPDIDIDFEDTKRDEIISYLKRKYGELKVANIVTYSTLKMKSAIRKVGEALGYPQNRIDHISKLISTRHEDFESELKDNYLLSKECQDPYYKKLITKAQSVLGFPINTSIHAAGVILSQDNINKKIEFASGVVMMEAPYLEDMGFLKMDILGLRNLSFIKNIESDLKLSHIEPVDISKHLDDKESYDVLNKLYLSNIFQLESAGIKQAIRQLKPESFDDLSALLALYRPGPMDSIPLYARRKNSKETYSTGYEVLDKILKNTYGIIIYQEQIMEIAMKVAKFDGGQADLLRRAISKKDALKMETLKAQFIEGATSNNYKKEDALKIYDLILKFANYGFNKSHSVAYSFITLKLLYYKAHFPHIFYKNALEEISLGDEKCQRIIEECNKMGIAVKGPDINLSQDSFVIIENQIYSSINDIKGLTPTFKKELIERRKSVTSFKTLPHFLSVMSDAIDINSLKALINSGALDAFGYSRGGLNRKIDTLLSDSVYYRDDDILQVDDVHDDVADFIKEKMTLGRVLTDRLLKLVERTDDKIILIATSDETKTTSGLYFNGTDGQKDYVVYYDKPHEIKTYDIVALKGEINYRKSNIKATYLEKENKNG